MATRGRVGMLTHLLQCLRQFAQPLKSIDLNHYKVRNLDCTIIPFASTHLSVNVDEMKVSEWSTELGLVAGRMLLRAFFLL